MADLPKGLGNMKELLRRFKKAKETWNLWRSLYQEASDFAAPQRSTFSETSPGQRKNRHIYDSTAVLGLEQFANRIQHSVLPPWREWMQLEAGSNVPEDQKKAVASDLEEATATFFKFLNHSNFVTELPPSLSDYGMGTGAIMVEEGAFGEDEALNFTNVPLAELYLEDLKNVWRDQEIPCGKIKENWPEAKLSDSLATLAQNEPLKKVKLINGMVYNLQDRKYYHLIIYEKEKKLLFSQAFDTQRLIVFRWHVTPGEVYGRGPILQVLADIRTLNKVKELTLQNAAIQMVGLYTGINDGIFNPNTVQVVPGAIIPVGQNGTQNPSLQALPRAGDIGLSSFVIEDMQTNVRKALFVEPLGDIKDPVRSATEIMLRNQEMLKQAGAALGRLKTELVEPLVAACVEILAGRGLLPKIRVDGRDVSLKQTSPLAAAEDQEDFQNSQIWFSSIEQLGQLIGREAIMGTVKIEDLPGYWAEKLDIPEKLIRSKVERAEFGKKAMEAAQVMQQMEQQGGASGGQPTQPV
jgi:hypothetical protein